MNILVTGASGFVGKALIPHLVEQGHKVYALSRHPEPPSPGVVPLTGDVTLPELGLSEVPVLDKVYHLAAIHRLGGDTDGEIARTNIEGTTQVIRFCHNFGIPSLGFCSTAYTIGRNPYERSKIACDELVLNSGLCHTTVYKPSVIMGTEQHFFPGHVSQFVQLVVRVHQRLELVRRKLEGTLRLPILEPVFRLRGNPAGHLNLVSVEDVARGMAMLRQPGVVWLTNPQPPTLQEVVDWVGEFIMVKMSVLSEPFRPSTLESAFVKFARAFQPYLEGDGFRSDLAGAATIDRAFIHATLVKTFLS